jgi:flagellar biosynthesis/type III secretory pathway chaperone
MTVHRESPAESAAGRELVENLAALHEGLRQLLALADEKLAGMRAAAPTALLACASREAALLEQVACNTAARRAILARLAQRLRQPDLARAPLGAISEIFDEPVSSLLRARNAGLRDVTQKLQQRNELAADVARRLQGHVRSIFAEITKVAVESVVYGPNGNHEASCRRMLVDAIG